MVKYREDKKMDKKKIVKINDRNIYLASVAYSFLLGASFVFGRSLYDDWGIEKKDFLMWLAVSGVLLCVFPHIMKFILDRSKKHLLRKVSEFGLKRWAIRSIAILVCWLPYFLTFYPGNGSSDSYSTILQVKGAWPLSNHHPVMFTLFVKLCLKIGESLGGGTGEGIAVFSVAQMLLMAFAFSACVEWMKSRGISRLWQWVATLFWALNPIIALYSITMWKDVLFSIWILLFVIYLYDAVMREPEYVSSAKSLTLLGGVSLLTAFGRNNGIYIVVLVLAALILVYRKYWKRLLSFSMILVTAVVLIQGPGYEMLGIEKGSFAESVAIPLQQIGHTVAGNGKMTEEQEEFIDHLLPVETIKEVYDPYMVDAIKFNEGFDKSYLENNKMEFLWTWAKMFPENLKGYIEAYALQTLGYWYVDITNWKCTFGLEYTDKYEVNIVQNLTGIDSSTLIQNMIVRNDMTPVIRYLFKVALPVWLGLLVCFIMILQRRKKYILSLLPLIGTWGTLMIATPVYCEFRYMFGLHLSLPVLGAFLFHMTEISMFMPRQHDMKERKVCFEK